MIKIKCDVCATKYSKEENECPYCHALTSENSIINAEHQLIVNDVMYSLDGIYEKVAKAMELYRESEYREAMAKQLPWYKSRKKKQLDNNSVILMTYALQGIEDVLLLTIEDCELYNIWDFRFKILKEQRLPKDNQELSMEMRQFIIEHQRNRKAKLTRGL